MLSSDANAYEIFVQTIAQSYVVPGKVSILLPSIDGDATTEMYYINAFLDGDFSFTLGNNWQSILPDADTARQVGQILGKQNQLTWIQSSASAWKSSDPMEFTLPVYLVTLKYGQYPSIIHQAKQLMKFSALYVDDNKNFATAKVHGGYSVDYTMSNEDLNFWTSRGKVGNKSAETISAHATNAFNTVVAGSTTGTIAIKLNSYLTISNLLLTKSTYTISQSYVDPETPLYIKMDLGFRSSRALLTADIDNMFQVTNDYIARED